MIIRYGRVVCRNYQSQRLEVEYDFDSRWTFDEGLCAVKAIVFAALRLPVPEFNKAITICRQALDLDLKDLIKQQTILTKKEKRMKHLSYCFHCEDFTVADDGCRRCDRDGLS